MLVGRSTQQGFCFSVLVECLAGPYYPTGFDDLKENVCDFK